MAKVSHQVVVDGIGLGKQRALEVAQHPDDLGAVADGLERPLGTGGLGDDPLYRHTRGSVCQMGEGGNLHFDKTAVTLGVHNF